MGDLTHARDDTRPTPWVNQGQLRAEERDAQMTSTPRAAPHARRSTRRKAVTKRLSLGRTCPNRTGVERSGSRSLKHPLVRQPDAHRRTWPRSGAQFAAPGGRVGDLLG